MEQWMSLRAYARHRGVALSAVQKAIESRRVTAIREEGDRITGVERYQADEQWAANTDAVEAARNGKFAAPGVGLQLTPQPASQPAEKPVAEKPAAEKAAPADTGDQGNFLAARVKEAELRGQLLELDKLERIDALAPIADMESESMEIFAELKNAVLRVPSRKAQTLAGETDALRIERALSDELRKVFDEFSSRFAGMAEHAGMEEASPTAAA